MGLGICFGTVVSAVLDDTGDDSPDAIVKVKRLINRRGKQFCNITNWGFLNSDISFSITSAAYKYSGASYLPTTFKSVKAAFLLDGTTRYPLTEVKVGQAYGWLNPDDNSGRPEEFCITRIESGYWEVQFDKKPDSTYTVYMEIETQWSDLSANSDETVMPKSFEEAFVKYCDIGRFQQQGDTENYAIVQAEWWNAMAPRHSLLGQLLAQEGKNVPNNGVQVQMGAVAHGDYSEGLEDD